MVAALLRLRFRVLANTLKRSPVLLVATILGAIQAVVLLGIVLLGAIILAHGDTPPVMRDLIPVVAGSAALLGWIVLPLAVAGIEPTLDPRKLAPFPIPIRALMRAMLLVGLLWTPGIATLVASLLAAIVWWRSPAAVAATVLVAPLAVLLCVAGSRCAATLAGILVAGRGLARRVVVTAAALLVLLLPSITAVVGAVDVGRPPRGEEDLRIAAAAALLADTPLGAVWSIPSHVAAGQWPDAAASLLIALGLLALLLLVWRQSLARAFQTRAGSGGRAGRLGLGPFRIVPSTPAGAILARSLVSWLRDPRYSRQLVILPVLPALLILFALVVEVDAFAYAAAPTVAGLLPLSQFAALSFDGTAFGGQLAAGVRGRADRIGRSTAVLLIVLPVVVVVAVVSLAVIGALERLPAVLGMTLAAMLCALAVTAVSSALVVVPVPAIGRNPFGAVAGANTAQIVGSYAVALVEAVVLLPVLGVGITAMLTASPAFGWATLVAGVLWGTGLLLLGIRIGGRALDRNGPQLLARLARTASR